MTIKPTFKNPASGVEVIGRDGIKRHMLVCAFKGFMFWVRDDGAQYHAWITNGRLNIQPVSRLAPKGQE